MERKQQTAAENESGEEERSKVPVQFTRNLSGARSMQVPQHASSSPPLWVGGGEVGQQEAAGGGGRA